MYGLYHRLGHRGGLRCRSLAAVSTDGGVGLECVAEQRFECQELHTFTSPRVHSASQAQRTACRSACLYTIPLYFARGNLQTQKRIVFHFKIEISRQSWQTTQEYHPTTSQVALSPPIILRNTDISIDCKNTTDDALQNYLNSLKIQQSHYYTDVKLALGYTAVIISAITFAFDYKLGFEKTKYWTAAAVVLYFAFNGAFTYWIWAVEKGIIFMGSWKGRQVRPHAQTTHKHS